jgi:hypothetical protein
VAYNYINAAAQYVYGKDKYQAKIEVEGNFTFSQLDKEEFPHTMTTDKKQRWIAFKQRFWKPKFDKIIRKCKGQDRIESAHPTRLPNARSVPTAGELKAIIPDNFFKQAEQSHVMEDLIDQLAVISTETARKLLQNDTKKRKK